jgi:hypothetical protein
MKPLAGNEDEDALAVSSLAAGEGRNPLDQFRDHLSQLNRETRMNIGA